MNGCSFGESWVIGRDCLSFAFFKGWGRGAWNADGNGKIIQALSGHLGDIKRLLKSGLVANGDQCD